MSCDVVLKANMSARRSNFNNTIGIPNVGFDSQSGAQECRENA
jgi:hypothetical protein